jgi:hypothetical protein
MNIQRRRVNQQPELTVDYTITNIDEFGIVEADPIRIIYSDGSVLTTIPGDEDFPDAVYDPDAVNDEYNSLVYKDRLYLDVCIELEKIIPDAGNLYRLDVDGIVIIGIPSIYLEHAQTIITMLTEKFTDQLEWYELGIVWADAPVHEVEQDG